MHFQQLPALRRTIIVAVFPFVPRKCEAVVAEQMWMIRQSLTRMLHS
jgi:hypothetical protein